MENPEYNISVPNQSTIRIASVIMQILRVTKWPIQRCYSKEINSFQGHSLLIKIFQTHKYCQFCLSCIVLYDKCKT